MNYQRHGGLRSDLGKLFLARMWFSFVAAIPVLLILWHNWKVGWVAFPFVLFAAFNLTLAEVKADPKVLFYRRLLKWKAIKYEEMLECGTAWPPLAGFVKLNRFVFPWGRVYFVFDGSLYDNPFRKPQSELVRYVTDRMKGLEESQPTTTPAHDRQGLPIRTWIWAPCAGILVSLMGTLLLPSEVTQFHPRGDEWPRWLVVYDQAKTVVFSWPWNLLIFALFVLAAAKSDRKGAWAFAFVAGLLLPSLLLR